MCESITEVFENFFVEDLLDEMDNSEILNHLRDNNIPIAIKESVDIEDKMPDEGLHTEQAIQAFIEYCNRYGCKPFHELMERENVRKNNQRIQRSAKPACR